MRHVIFIFSEQAARGGGRGGCQTFFNSFFFLLQQTTCEIGHRVKYFFGLATNICTLKVRNNNNIPLPLLLRDSNLTLTHNHMLG